MRLPRRVAAGVVRLYQRTLSPLLGPACRYQPSCSHYAVEAIELHGAVRGVGLALGRLIRCAPWGSSGWDPVPRSDEELRGHFGP